MGRLAKKSFEIVIYNDYGIVRRRDTVKTASPVVARQRAISWMKVKNSPLSVITVDDGDGGYRIFEIIYGTPIGRMYWCNCRESDVGYRIFDVGIPTIGAQIMNVWADIERDLPWARSVHSTVTMFRENKWKIFAG